MDAIIGQNYIETDARGMDLSATLDCGQCFRWHPAEDGGWRGIVEGRAVTARCEGDRLRLYGAAPDDFERLWRPYFDLDRDYSALLKTLRKDPVLKDASAFRPGIRILRQPAWETLCSFILSANNNIPRIRGIIERFCSHFGMPLRDGNYSFPTPEGVAVLSEADLAPLRCGYRAAYLLDAARKVASGTADLDAIARMSLSEARLQLRGILGVGPKVAECILLFGMGRMEAFPVDVWIKKALALYYPDGLPYFSEPCAGLAQQHLFHWLRSRAAG